MTLAKQILYFALRMPFSIFKKDNLLYTLIILTVFVP
jgi:hypothetical protein